MHDPGYDAETDGSPPGTRRGFFFTRRPEPAQRWAGREPARFMPLPREAELDGGAWGDPAGGFTLRDALILGFYNIRLIAAIVLACAAIGLVAAATARTQFTADSLVIVFLGQENARAVDVVGAAPAALTVEGLKAVNSEISIIQSADVIRRAVESVGPGTLFPELGHRRLFGLLAPIPQERQVARATELFQAHLRVAAEDASNIVRISFYDPDRAIAIRAVQALVDAYFAERRLVYASANAAFLASQVSTTSRQLHDIDAQIQRVRDQYQVVDIGQDITLALNRLDSVVTRENQVRERQEAAHTELLGARQELADMPKTVFDSRAVTNQSPTDDSRNTLLRLQVERAHMAAQFAPTYAPLADLDRRIAAVQAQVAQNQKANYFTQRDIRNPSVDLVNSRITTLQLEDDALGKQLQELGRQYDTAQKRVDELRRAESTLHDLQRTRDVMEAIYRQFSLRQAGEQVQATLDETHNTNVHVVQQATAPLQGRSMRLSYLLAGLFCGLVFAAAAAIVATRLRQVYIMPLEAERDLGLAELADFDVAASGFEGDAARHEIASLAALLLDATVDGHPVSIVQFVAAAEEAGKAALVRALAMELAQGHGLRTLILDLQGDGAEQLRQLGTADRAVPVSDLGVPVYPTTVPSLWVSADAPSSTIGNSRALLSQSREQLRQLRRNFDMVLIIAARDPRDYVSRRLFGLVDANLLVLRAEQTRAPVAAQLRDMIRAAGGRLLGFAFTWRKYYIPAAIYRWL
jgi:uncharacterized protein involved in exopolysaccharide biosynthesis/Mrp family chromosome partitioning ATPase